MLVVKLDREMISFRQAVCWKVCAATAALASFNLLGITPAAAQSVQTFGESLAIEPFEQVDSNGVDLLSGKLRISGPVISVGSDQFRFTMGLQWTGTAWSFIDTPAIWRDNDGHFFVSYRGESFEFNGFGSGMNQVNGRSDVRLSCSTWSGKTVLKDCTFHSRDGDIVYFEGTSPAFLTASSGQQNLPLGNLAVKFIRVTSPRGNRTYTMPSSMSGRVVGAYYNPTVFLELSNMYIAINTPNNSDTNDHYLRPRNTTQIFSDEVGNQWRYTVNSNRNVTRVSVPGGLSDITYTYNDDHRVTSVTTSDGTWNYSYSSNHGIRTVTVSNPQGGQMVVRSNIERGFATFVQDELGRVTTYSYDSYGRMTESVAPEGNRISLVYDDRGNILSRTTFPRPNSGDSAIVETAVYPTGCSATPTCNRPLYVVDGRSNRTDFVYDAASGLPTVVTQPAATPGGPRPQIRSTYWSSTLGYPTRLVSTSQCMNLATCVGTPDEILTTYDYGVDQVPRLFGMAVTWNGQTLRTCYSYDGHGNRVSETLPSANLQGCPRQYWSARSPVENLPTPPAPPPPPPPPADDCGTNGQICP